jgi:outer membrane protein OmpA-like peptidoglycan-associated protein
LKRIAAILFIFLSSFAFSQNLSSKNKKAIQSFNKAFEYYNSYNYSESEYWCEQALRRDKNFLEVYYLLSDIYDETKRYDKKINVLKAAIEINPQKNALAFLTLAKTELNIGRYNDAQKHFKELQSYDVTGAYSRNIHLYLERCEFGIHALKNPVDFKPVNFGAEINSEFDEYHPTVTADENTLIYTRLIPTGKYTYNGKPEMQEDFYISNKSDSKYEASKAFGEPLNTYSNEGAQSISADGKLLFFTSCEFFEGKSPHGVSYGSCDIFMSKKTGDSWEKPENLGEVVNSKYWESQPSFSSDGKTLYFTSNRPGGKGKNDIWKTAMRSDGSWTSPVNLGDTINTEKHEQSPFIHYDNQTLYFASDGHLGMGKSDLFISRKDSSGNWGKAKNMGYPINTYDEEVSLSINIKGTRGYFASSKKSVFGGLDLYSFEINEENRPNQVTYVHGTVYDIETGKRLSSNIKLIDLEQNEEIAQANSDEITGEFLICLPSGKDYAFNVSKKGYLFYSENFRLRKTEDSLQTYYFQIPLSPLKKGKKTVLKNIFFAFDSYELEKTSFAELGKLYDFLIENPAIRIELAGHTDNTGSDSHNNTLSLLRAKAVYDHLIEKGIAKSRLSYKGYGSKQPIDTNNTEEGRQK